MKFRIVGTVQRAFLALAALRRNFYHQPTVLRVTDVVF
jgi:hypothetical protein